GWIVALDAVAAKPFPHLAPRADEREGDTRAVVLELHVRQRVCRCLEVGRADVRDAVRRAQDLDLRGECRRGWRLCPQGRTDSAGEQQRSAHDVDYCHLKVSEFGLQKL